jgi:signal peptidase II
LAAGAIGNLIDRLWMQKVTDMFWFRPINFPVFNIADSCITVAAIILVVKGMTEPQEKPQTVAKEAQRDESENSI